MISRFAMTGILLAATGFCALIVACGGDEAPSAPAPSAESVPAPAAQKFVEPTMPPIPSARPSNIGEELAVKVEMPDFYPADGPVFPGTSPSKVFVDGNKINVMFGTSDSPEDVLEFLNGELPRLGWDNAIVQRMSNSVTIEATKSDRSLTIMLSEFDAAPTLIAVMVTAD